MIAFENVSIRLGAFALRSTSLAIEAGAYAVLMGRTGAGKTTLLELLCGLKRPDGGRILVDGRDVTGLPPAARGVGYVPQDGVLFSTHTVREHLAFGLRLRGVRGAALRARCEALAEQLHIEHLLERRPAGLSGGERQRVALGRAIAWGPRVLALDEPLSALDGETRARMHDLLRALHAPGDVTVLHVTHDARDARQLADRVLRLQDGSITESAVTDPCADAPP